jgi:hypothetical protein
MRISKERMTRIATVQRVVVDLETSSQARIRRSGASDASVMAVTRCSRRLTVVIVRQIPYR